MSTSQPGSPGSGGSSRYDSSPVGGRQSQTPAPKYGDGTPPDPGPDPGTPGYGTPPDPGTPGYGTPLDPGTPGYGTPPDPGTPGYGAPPGTPPGECEHDDPDVPDGGYGPEDPDAPGPQEPPADGYGPEEPDHEDDPHGHPCPPSMSCDTRAIDDLQCEAAAVKAESDALAAVAAALAARRTAFETARAAYTVARDGATQSVKELDRTIDDLLDDTRCLLNKDDVECLDEAFGQVLDCLEDCPADDCGCVHDGCGFEEKTWTVGQMGGLLAEVEKIEKYFDDVLVTEAANLTQRIADLRELVVALSAAMKADPREDANRLYARALQARWILDSIWGRFQDVNDYQSALCWGLTCSLRGRQWLAQLAGKKKYAECQAASRAARCQWLEDKMVDETLATQLVLCPQGTGCAEETTLSTGQGT